MSIGLTEYEFTRMVAYLSRDHDHMSMDERKEKAKVLWESVLTQCEQCHACRVTYRNQDGNTEISFHVTL